MRNKFVAVTVANFLLDYKFSADFERYANAVFKLQTYIILRNLGPPDIKWSSGYLSRWFTSDDTGNSASITIS